MAYCTLIFSITSTLRNINYQYQRAWVIKDKPLKSIAKGVTKVTPTYNDKKERKQQSNKKENESIKRCLFCGFIAKNIGGLNNHLRSCNAARKKSEETKSRKKSIEATPLDLKKDSKKLLPKSAAENDTVRRWNKVHQEKERLKPSYNTVSDKIQESKSSKNEIYIISDGECEKMSYQKDNSEEDEDLCNLHIRQRKLKRKYSRK